MPISPTYRVREQVRTLVVSEKQNVILGKAGMETSRDEWGGVGEDLVSLSHDTILCTCVRMDGLYERRGG